MSAYSLKSIYQSLASTIFETDGKRYVFFKLDRKEYLRVMGMIGSLHDEYVEVLYDRREFTIIVLAQTWKRMFARRYKQIGRKFIVGRITCDVKETTTGYLAALLGILSPNNVSVYVQGAYTTDHIFVNYGDLEKALLLLNQLKGN